MYEINSTREAIAKQMYAIWISIKGKWVFAKSFSASLCFRSFLQFFSWLFHVLAALYHWCAVRPSRDCFPPSYNVPRPISLHLLKISFNIHFVPKPVQLKHQIEQFFPLSNVIINSRFESKTYCFWLHCNENNISSRSFASSIHNNC